MPIVSSMPSADELGGAIGTVLTNNGDDNNNNKSAFTILNSDSLGIFGKPNAIVRPVQRNNINSNFYGNNNDIAVNGTIIIDGVGEMNSNKLPKKNTISTKSDTDLQFSKELDLKLQKLQNQTKNSSKYVNF